MHEEARGDPSASAVNTTMTHVTTVRDARVPSALCYPERSDIARTDAVIRPPRQTDNL